MSTYERLPFFIWRKYAARGSWSTSSAISFTLGNGCIKTIERFAKKRAKLKVDTKLILAEGKKFGKIASKAIHSASETKGDLPAFLVLANGGAYEYTELPHYKAPPAKSVANEQANLLPLQHVG